jgi:hypothetical protein
MPSGKAQQGEFHLLRSSSFQVHLWACKVTVTSIFEVFHMLSQATIVHRLTFLLVIAWLFAGCASGSGADMTRSVTPASAAAKVALEQVGSPYRYGGDNKTGFDCSGLVHYSYLQVGKQVPRTTYDLWRQS